MKVRVVEVSERRTVATICAIFFGVITAFVLANHGDATSYGVLAVPLAAWSLSFVLARPRAPRTIRVQEIDFILDLVRDGEAIDVHVARGAVGVSLFVSTSRTKEARSWVLEVESEADARAICARLGAKWPGTDTTIAVPHPLLRAVRVDLALTAGVCAFLYGLGAGTFSNELFKLWFGIPALIGASLVSVLFFVELAFVRRLVVGSDALRGASPLADHLRLHAQRIAAVVHDVEEGDGDVRTAMLDRSSETLHAWLARLDALGAVAANGDGYRGGSWGSDELRRLAEDRAASVGVRLGALRLLSRHEAVPTELRTRIADDLGMERVRIVVEGAAEEAAEELDAESPVFLGHAEKRRR